jgi:hypothetical protein
MLSASFRQLLTGTALSIGSTGLALLLAEGVLRLAPSLLPPEAQVRLHWQALRHQDSGASVADSSLGSLPAPRQHTELQRADFRFSYTTDGYGFRNAEPWPDAAEIVTVGDSWVFGYGVDVEQSWVRLMADALPASRVLNLGITGAAPQQYVRAYERYGRPRHPKVLVLGLFPGNDIEDARTFDEWLRAGSPGNYDRWRFFKEDVPKSSAGIQNSSYLLLTLRALRKNWSSPFSSTTVTMADGGRLRLAPGFFASLPERARTGNPDFERVVATLEQADSVTRGQGTRLLIVLFPTKEEVYLPVLGKPAPEVVQAFNSELAARNMDYLDLLPVFREHARAGETLFYEVDGHPNTRGNRVIADAVLERLRSRDAAYGLAPVLAVRGADSAHPGGP